ncbi:MAG: CDP-alcohol phosphatidyltransferase family protein [Deltaproteobacteria bacterium]|nr:MAG: CDP-alcohol phosphatidyltransferase family protein [Deltaproteobacteria bacterium]
MRAAHTLDRTRVVTWANGLTLGRMISAPALAAAITAPAPRLAALLFALAVASDFLDGALARRRGETSALGGLLDHAADAVLVTSGLAGLAYAGSVPLLLPPLILLAFAQYALDSRALAGRALRPSSLGRWNGIAYYALLGTPVVRDALGLSFPADASVRGLGWLLVASTLLSIADRARALLRARRGG